MRPFIKPLFISLFAITLGFTSLTAVAANITVTTDSGGTGGSDCTLRDAITAANTDAGAGSCSAGSGDDVVVLPAASTITLTGADNSTDGSNGLPSVTTVISITGNGATIERDTGLVCNHDDINDIAEFRIFHIAASGTLTVNNATISNGCAEGAAPADQGGAVFVDGIFEISGGTVTGSSVTNDGGGIYGEGAITVSNGSVISNNVAFDDDGGGIHIAPGGELTVSDSTIIGNHTEGNANAGAIHCRDNSNIDIINSLVADNWTEGPSSNGGAMNCRGDLFISNSTFNNNHTEGASANGGGIFSSAGTLTIINSTFSNNRTEGTNASGGALYVRSDATIVNSTISSNSSSGNGGGIYHNSDTTSLEIMHSTITGNTVTRVDRDGGGIYIFQGSITLDSAIVADNSDLTGASDIIHNPQRITGLSGSYNIIGDAATAGGFTNGVDNNIVGAAIGAIIDTTLQDNGGSTETHALFAGSLAVDTIPPGTNGCGTTITDDQRGFVRPLNTNCDMGAYEGLVYVPPGELEAEPVPAMSVWGLGMLAGLLGFISIRRRFK